MRRAFIPWLLFALAVVALVVPIAQGTSSAKDPRVAGLIKKVNTLQKQVNLLIVKANCLTTAQGVVLRGQAANEGYHYTPDGGTTEQLRTAYDATLQGEAAQQYFATVNAQCVSGARTLYRSGGTLTGKARALH